ncbi:MAG: family 43 glycosylhydrolase [Muribaculum sp.]|nr:family 43 glycosylhydrolase [Muribaculaceae bacterium]MCM1081640.1 family 43 glycosylhydrolase [Muribaculum sp.]
MKKYLLQLMILSEAVAFAARPAFDGAYPDVHDPVIAFEDSTYYMFSTGIGIQLLSSHDMKQWKCEESPLTPIPTWLATLVPAYKGHTWAPDIINVDGTWYLYYSCSTFGKNISAIGLATNKTLDPNSPDYRWLDKGSVIVSQPGRDNWNAIDPNVIIDEKGTPWLTFGSFWDGIQLVPLEKDMKTPVGTPTTIARRYNQDSIQNKANAIEAPFIVRHNGYYYLFASIDYCCKGLNSNYKTIVGRSKSITGPYVDKTGTDMKTGGGTILLQADSRYAGIGHCGVHRFDGKWYIVAHAYDKRHRGTSKLFLREIQWSNDWPGIIEMRP